MGPTHVQTKPTKVPGENDDLNDHKSIVESLVNAATANRPSTTEENSRTNQPPQSSRDQQLDTVPSSVQQYDALASLVNVAAQHGSDETASKSAEYQSSIGTNGASLIRPQGQTSAGPTTAAVNDEHETHLSQSTARITYSDGTLTSIMPVDCLSLLPTKTVQAANDMESSLTLGDATATRISSSLYIAGTQTLQPGGAAITIVSNPISLASDATVVVVVSSTSSLVATRGIGDYVWAGIAGMLSASEDDKMSTGGATEGNTNEATDNAAAAVSRISTTILSTANDGRVVTATILVGETASSTQGNLLSTVVEGVAEEATNINAGFISPTSITVTSTAEDGQIMTATISAESSATSSAGTVPPTSSVVVQTSEATTQQPEPSEAIDETTSTAASDTNTALTPNTAVVAAARTDRGHVVNGVVVAYTLSILMLQLLI